jgi:hypothetical protein
MPTGYTAPLYEGEPITFAEFASRCARVFGALVEMRDEPIDAPLPEQITVDSYYGKAVIEARSELEALLCLTPEEIDRRAEADYSEALAEHERSRKERAALLGRYESMLAEVNAWTPPTPEHERLKAFMQEQITESIRFDCGREPEAPQRLTGAEWYHREVEYASRRFARNLEAHSEAVERAKERNAWLQALRGSLRGAR